MYDILLYRYINLCAVKCVYVQLKLHINSIYLKIVIFMYFFTYIHFYMCIYLDADTWVQNGGESFI